MPDRRKMITLGGVIVSAMLLMGSNGILPQKQNPKEKLAKSSVKMKFNRKDSRVPTTSGPVYYKTNGGKPEDMTREFLNATMSNYGFDPELNDIQISRIDKTPGGTTVFFSQIIDGIPVYMSNSSITINNDSTVTWANILYRPSARARKGAQNAVRSQMINSRNAEKIAIEYLDVKGKIHNKTKPVIQWFDHEEKGMILVWNCNIVADDPDGSWEIFIDAKDGTVLQATDCRFFANGVGMVFYPNPLKTAHVSYGGDYADHNDSDNVALNSQRRSVILRDITKDVGGLYKLRGPHCVMHEIGGTVDQFPERTDSCFNFTRSADEFEDVMCYYHIDSSARYLKEMGFYSSGLDSMKTDPHGTSDGNSYFDHNFNWIMMGDASIDAAEDGEAILHEYGHAIEHNVGIGLNSTSMHWEPRAVWEGYGDYWSISNWAAVDSYAWDTILYWWMAEPALQHNRRLLRTDMVYPKPSFFDEQAYATSQITSSALMRIWNAIGKRTTDTLFLQTIKQLPANPTMTRAAMAFIDAEYNIYHGLHRDAILESFDHYGLIQHIDRIPYSVIDNIGYYDTAAGMVAPRAPDWPLTAAFNSDNEHFLSLNHAASINISTCSPVTNFNTIIAVFGKNDTSALYYNDDASCSFDSTHSVLKNVNLPAGEYYVVVGAQGSDVYTGEYELSVDYARTLEVYTADWSFNQNNLVKPSFHIVNTGSDPVSNFTLRYYFTVENGKIPVLDDYYTPLCTPYLENYGNGFYCIKVVFNGVTLNAGQRYPAYSEIQVGVHNSDWSVWNKSNDFSQPGPLMSLNNKVALFNSADYQIYGQIPDMNHFVPPKQDLKVYMLDEGINEINAVKPRFFINNIDGSTLGNFTMKYYFTVENGKTPVADDYWTPNCAVSLQHISGNNWCAVIDFNGYTLQAGGRVPADNGIVFGIHYSDWTTWNKSNDFSQPSGSYTLANKVAIFNSSGELVYGSAP